MTQFIQGCKYRRGIVLYHLKEHTSQMRLILFRKGSVVASFTLYFNALDSFQVLFLMDAVDVDHTLGKMPVVQSNQTTANFSSSSGQSLIAIIFTKV